MRFPTSILACSALLVCHCTASVKTTSGTAGNPPSGAPASSGPAPTPAAATPVAKPPRPTTKAGCDACNGQWGHHGIAEQESCICKTKDGGKSCRDGAECEGACIVGDDAKFEVDANGNPPRGHFVGRCADYDATFGCYRMIPNGTSAKGPLPAEEAAPRFCVD